MQLVLDVDQSKALVLLQIMMIEGINTPDKEGYPILTRLVLYLLDSNSCLSAEEKINLVWPTIQHWFYKPDCKQEASDFLIHIWSELSEERQNKIWDIIRKDINNIDSISEREREICRRITWIKKISHSIPQDIEQFVEYSGYVQETDENLYSNTPKITTSIGNVYSTSIKYEEFIKYNTADHIKKLEEVSNNDIANDWLQPNNVGDLWKQWTQENFAKAFAELQEITKRKFYSQAWENLINSFCDIKKSATEFQSLFVELLSLKDLYQLQ